MLDKTKFGQTSNSHKRKFYQGKFEDKFIPRKYCGDYPIIYRSSWEFNYMISLERNQNVEKWSSESLIIEYYLNEKIDGKIIKKKHRYFPDFMVWMKSGEVFLLEVKPKSQSPRLKNQIKTDPVAYKNYCKWNAALEYCKKNNIIFKVLTEEQLIKH